MFAETSHTLNWVSLASYTGGVILLYYVFLSPIYNVFFHPLRKYPGPKLWAASALPWGFSFKAGTMHLSLWEMHEKYGPIVRVGPDELSYVKPEAWDDIYGRFRAGRRRENLKPNWYLSPDSNDILGAGMGDHGRMRKILNHGFTNTALLDQEPAIMAYVDLFIRRLRERANQPVSNHNKTQPIDLWRWFVYCMFDVTGNLAFGEDFGCLQDSMMHPWISFTLSTVKTTYLLLLCMRIPFFVCFSPLLTGYKLVKEYRQHRKVLRQTVDRRLMLETSRPDLVQVMLTKKDNLSLSREELYSNAVTLALGGSEVTASVLAGICYMLATHPDVQARLDAEVREVFTNEGQIDMRSTPKLAYLSAVIDETMRVHPPGPNALWRQTPPEGNWILGDFVPPNTIIGIPHRVMYRSECNFKRATEFIPERWLKNDKDSSEFANDRRDCFLPFSYGPRNCIGYNIVSDENSLAKAEIRVILARMIWNFEIEIDNQSRNWIDNQKSFLMWDKGGLFVNLTLKSGKNASLQ